MGLGLGGGGRRGRLRAMVNLHRPVTAPQAAPDWGGPKRPSSALGPNGYGIADTSKIGTGQVVRPITPGTPHVPGRVGSAREPYLRPDHAQRRGEFEAGQTYLQESGVEKVVEGMLKELLKKRPEDPLAFIERYLVNQKKYARKPGGSSPSRARGRAGADAGSGSRVGERKEVTSPTGRAGARAAGGGAQPERARPARPVSST